MWTCSKQERVRREIEIEFKSQPIDFEPNWRVDGDSEWHMTGRVENLMVCRPGDNPRLTVFEAIYNTTIPGVNSSKK